MLLGGAEAEAVLKHGAGRHSPCEAILEVTGARSSRCTWRWSQSWTAQWDPVSGTTWHHLGFCPDCAASVGELGDEPQEEVVAPRLSLWCGSMHRYGAWLVSMRSFGVYTRRA
ncbi:unnamed protein product [Symbiodinium natans]|uniref:Uncharacterized protein n=1 Tax=Symbiodinium natans TaxID=878477 RepID=A0A812PKP5_9DINO|nr:unnamed protein product [Symbiodinium natans]